MSISAFFTNDDDNDGVFVISFVASELDGIEF
jgi:hypothetical protein